MIDYKIKAYPTNYNGRRYRSRLEAKWAAFFDALKWDHEYEPYDLGEWSPDFLVKPKNAVPFLVEVKPLQEYCEQTVDRMTRTCARNELWGDESDICGALLTLVAPRVSKKTGTFMVEVGWLANKWSGADNPCPVSIGWMRDHWEPTMTADLVHLGRDGFFTAATGDGGPITEDVPWMAYEEYTMALWNNACNLVQWRGRDA